ncbi:MAG TPA: pyruvate dehydrogenase (acetyl-transferring), homodimeric type, partial [Actinomycetota bacterium]|nr:pyruvate dehydrogenase (acetyl-transferring), homodimeric type [Actinomycetota bacterium]
FPEPVSTPYVNTIPPALQAATPADAEMERRIRAFVRWNAAVMVVRANASSDGLGGHLATYASSASVYETGFNHFFRGKDDGGAGDQIFFQGHASPGIYARAFLEGRLSEEHLDCFRRETGGAGLSSYPHPRLMPDFWEFPTVSMGLGPLNAIYQARFNRYLQHRGIADTSGSKVWCFLGDGECDEPESMAGLPLAAREKLDNLIFVVNCNLQRLDGPVRGNGKVIQELEALFRGAGWNVIKVIWGSEWDPLIAADAEGVLVDKLNAAVDGEFQKCTVESGAYIRERLFGPDPRLRAMVEHLSDDDLAGMRRGGHDDRKLYAAYRAAVEHHGVPSVVLVKTVKGWALGPEIEGRNATHQIKKMSRPQLAALRDRLGLTADIPDAALDEALPPYCRPAPGSPEHEYLMSRRGALGGAVPKRVVRAAPIGQPDPSCFADFLEGSGNRPVSTTMAFAVLLRALLRDPTVGHRVVPIIPDEARTFGMDGLFSEVKIYSPTGQTYEPVDAGMQLSYRESAEGQILEEGITEAGAMASFSAAGTSYATWGEPMIPFYVFYSMFGFQRTGDAIWAFGDMRGRGFLCGATAGRTTLNGEGLQHEDGHSLLLASTVPNLAAYDPAFAYEVAVIVRDGIARMYGDDPEDVFYYLTLYNENYPMPAMPPGAVEEGIRRGMYRFAPAPEGPQRRATILFSGSAQAAAREAQQLLAADHDVAAELWSVTSYKALREEALSTDRWNRLHPTELARVPYVTESLLGSQGPLVAVSDYMQMVPDQVARWVPGHLSVLGTDGYGRSDTRAALRRHFGTDAAHVVVAVLKGLADSHEGKAEEVADAIAAYGIDPEAVEPRLA